MSLIEYQGIIVTYGYLAIMLGTFLEGEMILVLGGFLAHQGYLSLPGVIIAAFVGSMLTDQMFFLLGRFRGRPFLRKRPALLNRIARADNLLTRHRVPVTLGFRFLYGMRTVIPFALGLSSIRLALFVPLNAIGALIWASAGGSLGFVFGRSLSRAIQELGRHEAEVFASLAVAALLLWAVLLMRARRKPPPI
ncbi:DedA family protein [Desulfocurvibacter africanus]|uniref:VTT domain-containing protein n=2 Tax=Desulfocurvibacter africanus TaxID=873 RepID=F3YVT3_DESAF|nr:DedA family protein [Desulfocurvibacter africanus]EGJ48891.1 hypothetical protein Desaf_0538 [Desulfocurvibacter africanus subsp. africanus str. Walvis Bay]